MTDSAGLVEFLAVAAFVGVGLLLVLGLAGLVIFVAFIRRP